MIVTVASAVLTNFCTARVFCCVADVDAPASFLVGLNRSLLIENSLLRWPPSRIPRHDGSLHSQSSSRAPSSRLPCGAAPCFHSPSNVSALDFYLWLCGGGSRSCGGASYCGSYACLPSCGGVSHSRSPCGSASGGGSCMCLPSRDSPSTPRRLALYSGPNNLGLVVTSSSASPAGPTLVVPPVRAGSAPTTSCTPLHSCMSTPEGSTSPRIRILGRASKPERVNLNVSGERR